MRTKYLHSENKIYIYDDLLNQPSSTDSPTDHQTYTSSEFSNNVAPQQLYTIYEGGSSVSSGNNGSFALSNNMPYASTQGGQFILKTESEYQAYQQLLLN